MLLNVGCVWAFWAFCCTFSFRISAGELVPFPRGLRSVYIPTPIPPPPDTQPLPTILRDNRKGTNIFQESNLSGSSHNPVESIRPLLPLGATGATGRFVLPSQPVFDKAAPRNVSAITGNAAYLHCLVHNLANKSIIKNRRSESESLETKYKVSWIRQRDLHILTVGRYTYTTDDRYQVIHSRHSTDWILKIKYAQERDSGNYECQVSTKPIKSYIVNLNVFSAPKATIIGSPDMYVDKGSTINLTCIITHSPQPPQFIIWKHNSIELSYDSPRGGITMVTERGNTTTGYLLMKEARPSDTGNYTCAPSNTSPSDLRLHVLDGELPAAMQTNSAMSVLFTPSLAGIYLFIVGLLYVCVSFEQNMFPYTCFIGGS